MRRYQFICPATACFIAMLLLSPFFGLSQDSTILRSVKGEEKYAADVQSRLGTFNHQVDGYTSKTLDRLISQEKKMKVKVAKVDSIKANRLFNYAIDSLKKFQTVITNKAHRLSKFFAGNYFSHLDTLKQSLSFYKKGQDALNTVKGLQGRMDSSLNAVNQAEARLVTVDKLNTFLQQREVVLQGQLNSFPAIGNGLKNINKEVYYYQAQVSRYKETLQNPDKIERVVLDALQKTPNFQQYMRQNSELASLFNAPSSAIMGAAGTPVNGLPSGPELRQFMSKQFPDSGAGVIDKVRGDVMDASSANPSSDAGALLKSKLAGLQGNGNPTPPDFTPNGQHGLPFGKRLEFGFSTQFGGSTQFLPASANFGLQAGYKLDDKFSFGVGAAYTMGMGTGWNHIQLSNQSLGLRSYLKMKLKKSVYLQGGGEWNYLTAFTSVFQLKRFDAWQTTALVGAGKEVKISRKLSGSMALLYDLLWDQHFPRTQPLVFRISYNL